MPKSSKEGFEFGSFRGQGCCHAGQKNKQSLQQMLAKVFRKNLHAEVKSGAPVGREVW
jgi:hypothetical protein